MNNELLILLLTFAALAVAAAINNWLESRKNRLSNDRPAPQQTASAVLEQIQFTPLTHRELQGSVGESLVGKYLCANSSANALILHNVYLPTGNGRYSEVDLLMIDEYGFWVIESKNFSGWIFGAESQERWTQTFWSHRFKRSAKYYFYNPVLQNREHVRRLGARIGYTVPIISMVVFGPNATLRKLQLSKGCMPVIKLQQLPETLNTIRLGLKPVLSPDDIQLFGARLRYFTQPPAEVRSAHKQAVMQLQQKMNPQASPSQVHPFQ